VIVSARDIAMMAFHNESLLPVLRNSRVAWFDGCRMVRRGDNGGPGLKAQP
jgi:hypothetical protein